MGRRYETRTLMLGHNARYGWMEAGRVHARYSNFMALEGGG